MAVVDDDSIVRDALTSFLAPADDIEVVGTCENGREAVDLSASGAVDLVLMDVQMPVMDGIEATSRIKDIAPQVTVVILTTFDTDAGMLTALEAGASGFLLKDTRPEALIDVLRTAHCGAATVVTPRMAKRLVRHSHPEPVAEACATPEEVAKSLGLTTRECQIIHELCDAASNSEIGTRLCLSESTVKSYVSSIMMKLGCTSRLKVVIRAFELGLARPPHQR
ncbi:response regulator transcription factor [Devriesea agamarum]|uniref:response regulator transcription factor n=1 Tax=Devriesea agamarum TaxID=472569 RepID=UPI00155EB68B|nr:response regulator transcription factor [Devriesea agamarum]